MFSVFEILLGVSQGLTWKDAFLKVLPQRKGAVIKEDNGTKVNTQTEKSENSCIDSENSCNNDKLEKDLSIHSEDDKTIVKEENSES